MRKRKNWDAVIERLNASKSGKMTIQMGSPGSAQVTRVRLLERWSNLEAWTDGAKLHLQIAGR